MTGPILGAYVGHSYGMHLNEMDFLRDQKLLKRKLSDARAAQLAAEALKSSAHAVLDAMLAELAQEEKTGDVSARKLSNPSNVSMRNECFWDTAVGQLRRLSDMTLEFVSPGKLVQRSTLEMNAILRTPGLKPEPQRRA